MSYYEKPQIKLYKYENSSFVLQAIIDDYQEVSFEHNLFQAGAFTITINYNIPNARLFERGLFVQFGNNPYDFGEILTIQDSIGEDGKGSQTRTITGYDARYILKRRVIKNMNSNGLWVMTAKGELCIRNLIKDQCGSGAEAKRQLPISNTIPSASSAIGKEYSVSEQFSNLYEVCKTIATQSEIGWRLAFNGDTLTLECYTGTDRSQTVQFSTGFDSLANGEFSDSSESFSNAIYIGGKGQNDDRDIYEGENGTPSGLDRFESWDNQSSMTTESEYEAEAVSMLTQYGQTLTMSGNGLAKCPYIFREQYDIGDIIKVAFSGKSATAQILSVTEHWTWGAYDIQFSFGKPQNNLADQLQLMLRQIQKASEKANSTDSVRWYTIPTDTAMPKADVTYNTIGFVGDVGNGATFKLYLDNEKTGAKTYHVWFKQLAGNGKLTLTTGKSGAVDLSFGGGTYVAIISVDENGNIVDVASTPTNTIAVGNSQPATSDGVAQAISTATDSSRQGAYCETAGATQAKVASMKDFVLSTGVSFLVTFKNENTYNGKVTLNVNNTGAKDVYLNGSVTSSTNKTIRAGTYICWYSGSVYYIDIGWEVYCSRQSLITGRASYLQSFNCTTASATVAKVVSHFAYSLSTRSEILVYFSNTNTATNPTLNVNGTGAKAIRIYGVQPNSTNNLLVAGTYRGFYDGTYWNLEPYGVTNEIANNNMNSVTSNAVASALSNKADKTSLEWKTLEGNIIPSDLEYNEISISVWATLAQNTELLYSNTFAKGQLGGKQNVVIGGYYLSSYDFGLCNLNFINNEITLRNVYFDGQNITSSASLRIRYR